MKLTRNKIVGISVILIVLAAAFFWGGDFAPKGEAAALVDKGATFQKGICDLSGMDRGEKADLGLEEEPGKDGVLTALGEENGLENGREGGGQKQESQSGQEIDPKTGKDPYGTDPVPQGKPLPVEPDTRQEAANKKALGNQQGQVQNQAQGQGGTRTNAYTCTLSVSCETILDHMDSLSGGKEDLIPTDGVIFPATKVTFYEGESVFNVLQREMKANKIHMEFVNTPVYNSSYIEGIQNLYEFDCGELSGWMYRVNGWFPNYGSSRYQLADGDVVEWVYTCDWGRDLGSELGGMQY